MLSSDTANIHFFPGALCKLMKLEVMVPRGLEPNPAQLWACESKTCEGEPQACPEVLCYADRLDSLSESLMLWLELLVHVPRAV